MRKIVLFASVAVFLLMGYAFTGVAADHSYVGVGKCKMCHKSKAKGDQYGIWLKSAHSKAYETLASDESKAVAAKLGLEGDPQQLDECLSCHVTGHGVAAELLGKNYKVEDGVGCESCHGPGGDYWKSSVMKDREKAVAAGMIVPDEKTCVQCHNEKSPTFKEFDYEKMVAKIAHPYPDKAEKKE